MTLVAAAFTHRGHVRQRNEDAIAIGSELLASELAGPVSWPLHEQWPSVLVADGLGGHTAGSIASRLALTVLVGACEPDLDREGWEGTIRAANAEIYEAMARDPQLVGMGTTLVGISAGHDEIMHFNVGDSRLYRFSQGRLQRLSHDDVPFAQPGPRASHAITQSLGGQPSWQEVFPHLGVTPPLQRRERLLLCTDGLTDMVSENEIIETLCSEPEAAACTAALVNQALSAGGDDNVSVVIVQER
jgi:PPM family protein phosphatase